jgi:hypothetical protein
VKPVDDLSVKELRAEFIERGMPQPYMTEMKKDELRRRLRILRQEQDVKTEGAK